MTRSFSPGVWIIAALAALSSLAILTRARPPSAGLTMWTFARPHADMYRPIIDRWNASSPDPVSLRLIALNAMEQRMLAGFFAGVETADLLEVERSIAGRAFTGPLGAIGFTDLTDRLEREGLFDLINPPSFGPWRTRGRVFGIPHDVHPVMLGYRVDLIEAAGIDVSKIETWADFAREMRPLMTDENGDGQPDRYPLAFWPTDLDKIELLLLQRDIRLFDGEGRATIRTPEVAALIATMVSWCVGPDRIAAEVTDFSASGNALKIAGYAACFFMPDWMGDVWRKELPGMAGKLRLMPLPAWEPGGRRTSVWGGTMLAIPKSAPDFEAAWRFASYLYLSDELARELYRIGGIITPITAHWDDPVFDEPDPYFGGQAKGRMYIELAPHIPDRISSPYTRRAVERIADAALALLAHANRAGVYDADSLAPVAFDLLKSAQDAVDRQMARTAIFHEGGD